MVAMRMNMERMPMKRAGAPIVQTKRPIVTRSASKPESPMRAKARELHRVTPSGVNWNEQPLGQLSDRELGDRLGVKANLVSVARIKRGIPVFKKWDVTTHTPEVKAPVAYLAVQNGRQAHRSNDVPPDYAGEFIEPLRPELCCAVRRFNRGGTPIAPERCLNRRKSSHRKGGESLLCCSAHAKKEGEAVDWANTRHSKVVVHQNKGG